MTGELRHEIQTIYDSAIRSVLPATVLRQALALEKEHLIVDGEAFAIDQRPVYAIGIGKAAGEMMAEVEAILGDKLEAGIAVGKSLNSALSIRSTMMFGSHPVPDERSLAAGEAVLRFARAIPRGSLVLCLISGGGSALVESLRPGFSLDKLQEITRRLLRAGASIHELNAVRARLSEIKAGGLLQQLSGCEVVNLVVSDVLGDDLATIASGPTVPPASREQAETVLARYRIDAVLPDKQSCPEPDQPTSRIVGSLAIAIRAAANAARELGFTPVILTQSLTGEARSAGETLGSILADSARGLTTFGLRTCFIAGGETTVTLRGSGRGGRNTEAALAAAIRLTGVDGVAIGFLATDGDDAETTVAGGIVDGLTVDDMAAATRALNDNDSWTYLDQRDAAWGHGPTGTNVNDLVIGIVG